MKMERLEFEGVDGEACCEGVEGQASAGDEDGEA
jgi:hypothetical protein